MLFKTVYYEGNYTDEELMFLKAAVVGDMDKIRWLTNQYLVYAQFFNLNCTDQLDRTALSIAIVKGHVDIVKFLLEADLQGKLNKIIYNK